jgi:hypothetical protein
MTRFRNAFPDLYFFSGAADLIAEGDYVVGRWKNGGTHTCQALGDLEEIGLNDGVTALTQLGLIRTVQRLSG